MPTFDDRLLELAKPIRLLVLDIDGVLTDGRLYFTDGGEEVKAFNSKDGLGLKALMRYGIEVALITARRSQLVEQRAQQLTIEHLYQGKEDKLAAFEMLRQQLKLDYHQICYVGDDLLDLPVMTRVGFSVTVADGMEEVQERADWITRRNGGRGAVREVCDLILTAGDHYQSWLDSLMGT